MRTRTHVALVAGLLVAGIVVALELGGSGSANPIPDPDVAEMQRAVRKVIGDARRAVVADPSSAVAWGRYGSALFAHELFADAEPCYRHAAELAPQDFRWKYLLAGVLDQAGGDEEEILALYGAAESLQPDFPPTPYRLATVLARLGRHAEACAAFERALALDPNLAIAHRGLAQSLLATGDAGGALEHLQRAERLAPGDAQVASALAIAYGRLGEDDLARRAAERSRTDSATVSLPDPVQFEVDALAMSSEKCFARAKTRVERGESELAIADLAVVLETRPDDPAALALLGRAEGQLGKGDLALQHLQRAVELAPENGAHRAALAFELAREDRLEEANQAYGRADGLTSLDPADLQTWGNVLLKLGRPAEAVPRYERVVARQPRNRDALWALGLAEESLGMTDEAIGHYRALLALDPEHAAAERLRRLESGR